MFTFSWTTGFLLILTLKTFVALSHTTTPHHSHTPHLPVFLLVDLSSVHTWMTIWLLCNQYYIGFSNISIVRLTVRFVVDEGMRGRRDDELLNGMARRSTGCSSLMQWMGDGETVRLVYASIHLWTETPLRPLIRTYKEKLYIEWLLFGETLLSTLDVSFSLVSCWI